MIMTRIIKYLVALLVCILFSSCKFDLNITGVKGNGDVITQERFTDVPFTEIKASEGLNVYITQSNHTNVKVQADENIQDAISTEVRDGVLYLETTTHIRKAHAKKVLVHYTTLNNIRSSSGSKVQSTNAINTNMLNVKASSGSSQHLNITANQVTCDTSSGALVKLSGDTNDINATSSSGSSIKAVDLIANNCSTKSSSGSSIKVHCKESLTAKASSGSSTKYSGSATSVTKSKSSGASIRKH